MTKNLFFCLLQPVTVASHPHVDDVSAAVLLDAKAAAEAAIKAALAKGNPGSFGKRFDLLVFNFEADYGVHERFRLERCQ